MRSENRMLPAGAEGRPCKMSRQDQLNPPTFDRDSIEPTADETRLEIDLRLKLDEVCGMEADLLRARACRQPSRRELCQLACSIYDARRTRDRLLDSTLFGEPGWDTLLALYVLPARGEMLRATALAHAANVPTTTGFRWQQLLVNEGLVERGPSELPPRRRFFRLTDKGRTLLEHYLSRLFYHAVPIAPFPERAGG
jgi:DNA-binding MarR family transcriptional regulator